MGPQGHIRKIYICSFCRCMGGVHFVHAKRNGSSPKSKISDEDEGLDSLLRQEAFV